MEASTNSGDNGSGVVVVAVASERPCWISDQQRKGKGSGNGGAATAVMAAIVDSNGGAGLTR